MQASTNSGLATPSLATQHRTTSLATDSYPNFRIMHHPQVIGVSLQMVLRTHLRPPQTRHGSMVEPLEQDPVPLSGQCTLLLFKVEWESSELLLLLQSECLLTESVVEISNVILLRKVLWVGGGWRHCNYSYKLQVQVSY